MSLDAREELAERLASLPGVGRVCIEMMDGTAESTGLHDTISEMETFGLGIMTLLNAARSRLMKGETLEPDRLMMMAERMAEAIYESEPD